MTSLFVSMPKGPSCITFIVCAKRTFLYYSVMPKGPSCIIVSVMLKGPSCITVCVVLKGPSCIPVECHAKRAFMYYY